MREGYLEYFEIKIPKADQSPIQTYKHEGDFYYMDGKVLIGEAKEVHSMELVCYYELDENTMYWYSLHANGNGISLPKDFEEPQIEERQKTSDE